MEQGNYAAALSAYKVNLKIRPGRFNSIGGAGRAAELLGNQDEAHRFYTQLLKVAREGNTDRPEIEFARSFLGS